MGNSWKLYEPTEMPINTLFPRHINLKKKWVSTGKVLVSALSRLKHGFNSPRERQ
jgi:hypothetical protein